jgi:antitoxin MazE
MSIRVRIIKIGNSQGIRIPKPVLEQAGLEDEVEIEVQNGMFAP